MALLPKVKLKALVSFPSSIVDGAGIDVSKVNGAFKLDLAFDDFAPPVTGVADAAHQNALLWNSVTNSYILAPITILGSGGAVPEAPNDGVQYGRQSLSWTPVTGGSAVLPSNTSPVMDGAATPGASLLYARGDHIHPSDTTKIGEAPLDGQAYIRQSAAWSLTTGGAPSNATPIVDGTATPGVLTLYSRGDHVHPTDNTRQAADTDLTAVAALSGTGIARRTSTTPSWSVGDAVANTELSVMSAFTLKGNNFGGLATPTDIDIAALVSKTSPAGGDYVLLSDQAASGAWKKLPIANFPGASGGIVEAPNDGLQYGRQSLGWTQISGGGVSPSGALPIMDSAANAGTSSLYSRGDHIHPSDTSRAPLVSPVFTGDPKAPTPTAGDNDTSIATTAFVTTAVATASGASPSNASPLIDATVAAPGISLLYSRGDHVHPTDTSRAPLASPTFTGDPKAPTPTAGDNDTSVATTAFVNTAAASSVAASAVRYDAAQSLTDAQQLQARQNIYAAPFGALAFNGMQINGSMEVSQENLSTAVAVGTGTVTKYILDGLMAKKSGTSAFTVQQVASSFPGYNSSAKLVVTTAQPTIGSDEVRLESMIEGYRFVKAQWGTSTAQPVTIGCWIKSSLNGTFAVQIVNGAVSVASAGSITITTANVAQWVTCTFTGDTTGGAWNSTSGSGAKISLIVAVSGGPNIVGTVGNTFEMTGLVVLPGSQAPTAAQSPLIMRPYDQELATCQRYFRLQAPEGTGLAPAATTVIFPMRHQGMRTAPTISATGPIVVSNISAANFTQSAANATSTNVNADWGEYTLANFSGLTIGAAYQVRPDTGGHRIKLDARLL